VLQQEVDPHLPPGTRVVPAEGDAIDDVPLPFAQVGRNQRAIDADGPGEVEQRHEVRVPDLEQVAGVEAILEQPLDAAIVKLANHVGTGTPRGRRCLGRGIGHGAFLLR
jgi:hypothetical protein